MISVRWLNGSINNFPCIGTAYLDFRGVGTPQRGLVCIIQRQCWGVFLARFSSTNYVARQKPVHEPRVRSVDEMVLRLRIVMAHLLSGIRGQREILVHVGVVDPINKIGVPDKIRFKNSHSSLKMRQLFRCLCTSRSYFNLIFTACVKVQNP